MGICTAAASWADGALGLGMGVAHGFSVLEPPPPSGCPRRCPPEGWRGAWAWCFVVSGSRFWASLNTLLPKSRDTSRPSSPRYSIISCPGLLFSGEMPSCGNVFLLKPAKGRGRLSWPADPHKTIACTGCGTGWTWGQVPPTWPPRGLHPNGVQGRSGQRLLPEEVSCPRLQGPLLVLSEFMHLFLWWPAVTACLCPPWWLMMPTWGSSLKGCFVSGLVLWVRRGKRKERPGGQGAEPHPGGHLGRAPELLWEPPWPPLSSFNNNRPADLRGWFVEPRGTAFTDSPSKD